MKQFKQLREGLWANIHNKRKRGEKMRKKGEKGAPTADAMAKAKAGSKNGSTSMEAVEELYTQLEKAYDAKDVAKVRVLERKFQALLKEVDKTMKGSGLSAPAFSVVRSGITKALQAIKKFYAVANKNESFNIEEKVGQMRPWKKGFDPAEEDQLRKDKKLKKDLETYAKKKNQIRSIKDAEKLIPYLLNHINTNFGNGKGGKLGDDKFHQLANAINFYYDYEHLYEDGLTEGKGTDAALQKKADASGISKGILKKVYDRGLAAWKVGHKPGTTPQQWGMARVNSFITKGKVWHKYDSDLRKQHQGK